jgi:hypothetical protein
MMRWVDEIANRERIEELFFRKEIFLIRWFDHLIWSIDFYLITSSFNSSCINDSITNRICLFKTIRIVKFFINILISKRVVLRSFNRDDLFKSKWFLSYLLIFEIVEKSKNSKMSMRSWWDQIEVTTELEDILIKRMKSRDDRRSRFSEKSRWVMNWKFYKWDCRRRIFI